MAYASDRNVYADIPLSNFAVAAFSAPSSMQGFVGEQIAPAVNVGKQSATYYILDPDNFFIREASLRAAGTKAKKINWTVSSGTYNARNYALADDIPVEDLANEDQALQLRQNSVSQLVGQLRLDQEIRIADAITSISNVGSGVALTGTSKWSDYTNSDPLATVNTAQAFIRMRTGLIPNCAVIDWDTMQILRRHPDLLDLYKYTAGGQLPNDLVRDAFGVQELHIAYANRNRQREGLNPSSMTTVWGNVCVLMHKQPSAGLQTATPIVRMQWQSPAYPANFGVLTSQIDEAGSEHVERIEAGHYQDEKIVARDLAYAITGTL
jgi:hypothetical protein